VRRERGIDRERGVRERVALVELACFIAFVQLMIWVTEPHASRSIRLATYVALVVYAIVTARAHHESRGDLGLRLDNIAVSARDVFPATFVLGAALVIVGFALGSLRVDARGLDRALLYLVWAFLQQYALQAIVFRRLLVAGAGPRRAAFVAAIIFSSAHIPNVPLMAFTFAGGWLWTTWFRRHPNLFTLAVSHAVLAIVLVSALPPGVMQNLRVGPGYLSSIHKRSR
jgi:hypothetical protein